MIIKKITDFFKQVDTNLASIVSSPPFFLIPTAAISLTLSDLNSNFESKSLANKFYNSLLTILNSPFKKGDFIKTQGQEGIVEDINFRFLKLKKKDKVYVFIPTASVFKNIIEIKYN